VRTFAELLAGKTSLIQITDELAAFACGTWGWSRPVVLRRDAGHDHYVAPPSPKRTPAVSLTADHPLIVALLQQQLSVTVEDLEGSARAGDREAAAACRTAGWDVCLPVIADGVLHALLVFQRHERAPATMADLELLDSLAALAGAAIVRARMHNELQLAQDAIRRAERLSSLGTLSASIAHEIRNQMVAIQTFLQLLPERLDDPEFLTSFLALARDEAKRIATLVGELLAFARTTDRGVGRESLNELLERTTTILQAEAKKWQVSLQLQLAADLPMFFGNGDKIKQVITNLVLNAIQATSAAGTVVVTTRVLHLGDVDRLQLEICDSGCGIAAEHLDQVFTPFFTTKSEGTGLGLAISRGIIREHDGEIYVESGAGRGATFTIELPAAPPLA